MQQLSSHRFRIGLLLTFFLTLAVCPPPVRAQNSGTAVISGRILETSAGLPVGGAQLQLLSGPSVVDTTTTTSDGTFAFKNVAAGTYSVVISASGYQTTRTPPITVSPGQVSVDFQTAIAPVAAGLQQIANVVSSRQALQTSATINQSLPPNIILDQNYIRAGDALSQLPFVSSSTSSSLGDDESVSIRGFNPTESATLLDGHPLGPIGVKAGDRYDYQLAQFWGYGNINVIYGSGATGLYGIPTLAGAVDFQTISPTPQNHFTFMQGYGDLNKLMTGLQFTGTSGPFGYAFSYGVEGTDGEVGPANILQSGLLAGGYNRCPGSPSFATYEPLVENGTNASLPPSITSADTASCSYLLSGQYLNRNVVGKVTYQISQHTQLQLTAYNASMFAYSQGNGDTDYQTQAFELAQANGIVGSGTNNFTLANGMMTGCSASTIAALNNSPGGYTCLTQAQYAADFQGPAGGGPGRDHFAVNHKTITPDSRKTSAPGR